MIVFVYNRRENDDNFSVKMFNTVKSFLNSQRGSFTGSDGKKYYFDFTGLNTVRINGLRYDVAKDGFGITFGSDHIEIRVD